MQCFFWIMLVVLFTVAFITVVIIILAALLISANIVTWVPYMPTPQSVIKIVVEQVKIKKTSKVYDLGSGDGRVLEALEKKWGVRGIGYELSIVPLLVAKWRLRNLGSKVYFKNFFKVSLVDADVVFCFLTPYVIPKVQEKLLKELKSGALLVSYGSEVKGFKMVEKILRNKEKGQLSDLYIYKKK